MREWLSGGVSPCQGEGRGFESRLALNNKRGIFDRRFLFYYSVFRSDSNHHRVNLGRMGMEAQMPRLPFFPWLCGVHFTEQRHNEDVAGSNPVSRLMNMIGKSYFIGLPDFFMYL